MIRNASMLKTLAALLLLCQPAVAQQPTSAVDQAANSETDVSPGELRARSVDALEQGDQATAIAAADSMMRKWPDDAGVIRTAGDVYLRAGKVDSATRLFNRYVKEQPNQLPYLWQRGISLYFTGDYEEAAEQFEVHRTVNPNDVENAAWHFLCVAKSKSVETAKQLVLPAPGDPRLPMEEVLGMLSTGNREAVIARVEALPTDSDARKSAEFYGDFYLGLYADAMGEKKAALKYLKRAAADAPHNYMGDVARVYATFLQQ